MSAEADNERRITRELRTVRVMIGMYCRGHHGGAPELCERCSSLWNYARQRVERCPFRADKPTCLKCPVHCYQPDLREQIRVVMRYAGPPSQNATPSRWTLAEASRDVRLPV